MDECCFDENCMRQLQKSGSRIGCMTRLLHGKMSLGVGRRLVELNKSQDTASRGNNNVECITKSLKTSDRPGEMSLGRRVLLGPDRLVICCLDRHRMVLLKDVVQVSQWICRYGKMSCVGLVSCQFIIQAALLRLHSVLLGRMLLGQNVDDVSIPGSVG